MRMRFCLECENLDDRKEIEGAAVCAKGHRPGISCPDFKDKFGKNTVSKTRFCFECENFEDRKEIEGVVVCAKGHRPRTGCPDFRDRVTDIFYSYIYWASLYKAERLSEGASYYEEKFSRNLSPQELAYACLAEYFSLGLDYDDFHDCWKNAREIYENRLPTISRILNEASSRFEHHGERTNLRKVFLDLLSSGKTPEEIFRKISEGHYIIGR